MTADSEFPAVCAAWCTGYNCLHESCVGCGVLDEHGCWRPPNVPCPPAIPPAPPFDFVRRSNNHPSVLTEDGRTAFRFAGANVYWLMSEAAQGAYGRQQCVTRECCTMHYAASDLCTETRSRSMATRVCVRCKPACVRSSTTS